jgi:hypothetical protein
VSVDCGDSGEEVVVDNQRRVRARKEHRCHACKETIERGHLYVRHTLIYGGQVDETIRCLRCDTIYQELVVIHRQANEEARQERMASRAPGYYDKLLTDEQKRLLYYDSDWPDVSLNCGHEFKERWGREPPPELARLAFLLPSEIQAEALAKMTAKETV